LETVDFKNRLRNIVQTRDQLLSVAPLGDDDDDDDNDDNRCRFYEPPFRPKKFSDKFPARNEDQNFMPNLQAIIFLHNGLGQFFYLAALKSCPIPCKFVNLYLMIFKVLYVNYGQKLFYQIESRSGESNEVDGGTVQCDSGNLGSILQNSIFVEKLSDTFDIFITDKFSTERYRLNLIT
jgi:hypothetical protein